MEAIADDLLAIKIRKFGGPTISMKIHNARTIKVPRFRCGKLPAELVLSALAKCGRVSELASNLPRTSRFRSSAN